jgi:hypothetical protein
MTNTVRNVLIASAAVASNAIVGVTFYIKGKTDGLALAAKRQAELTAAPAHNGNRRSEQAQA